MSAPDRIWIQIADEDGNEMAWYDWTHCQDRIYESDVEYIRADLLLANDTGKPLHLCAIEDCDRPAVHIIGARAYCAMHGAARMECRQ